MRVRTGRSVAVVTTSLIYLLIAFLLACSVNGVLLRDRDGLSINQQLVEAVVAWPSPYVIIVGALCACFGAGLQWYVESQPCRSVAFFNRDDCVV